MSLLNPEHPDVRHAVECVRIALPLDDEPACDVMHHQRYLADMVQANHRRNLDDARAVAIETHARYLLSRSRRPKHRALNVVDLSTKAKAA